MSTQPPATQATGSDGAQAEPRPLPRARLEPGTLLGDWRIEGLIGVGGMGTVYAAVHTVIGKRAAIKVVRSELVSNPLTSERFVQEAKVANTIGHPNIVDIFHIGQLEDGRPYLVMELLQGCTLGRRMQDGRVAPHEAIAILVQICDALAAAHARGVVHRDLKPDNVFLCEGEPAQVKLVDWGIAKLIDAIPRDTNLTTTGTLVGTPQYMSPEQARARAVDGRTDVYALGAIAYELFLEGPPFQADNIADLVTMHLREEPPAPSEVWPDIPRDLEALLLAMLAKSPDDRPSLETICETLRRVADAFGTRRRLRPRSERFVLQSPPDLVDRAPTWGMVPFAGVEEEPSWRPGLRVVAPRGVRAETDAPIPTPPAPPASGAQRFARYAGIASAVLTLAATTMVLVGAGDPGLLTAAVQATATPRAPSGLLAEVPEVAAGATLELPEVAPATFAHAAVDAQPVAHGNAAAKLDLRVQPRTARVTVDGVAAEVAGGRVVTAVEPGLLEITIEAPGHAPYRRSIEIGPGTVMLDVRLKPQRRAVPQHQPESRRAVLDVDPDGTIDPF